MPGFLFAQLWPGQTQRHSSIPKTRSSEIKINDLVLEKVFFIIIWAAVQKAHLFVPKYNRSMYTFYKTQCKPWNTSWVFSCSFRTGSKMEGLQLYQCVMKRSGEGNGAMRLGKVLNEPLKRGEKKKTWTHFHLYSFNAKNYPSLTTGLGSVPKSAGKYCFVIECTNKKFDSYYRRSPEL